MKKSVLLLGFLPLLLLTACDPFPETSSFPDEVKGLKPVYHPKSTVFDLQTLPARPLRQLHKFYHKTPYLFISELNQGVHVIDNSDPTHPVNLQFLQIPGCHDIAVKGSVLYADNHTDLVALDISNLSDVKLLKRISGLYPKDEKNLYPAGYQGWFECADPALGVVIGWETATLHQPQCWR